MKKTINTIFAAAALCLTVSCSFLEENPQSVFTKDNAITDAKGLMAALVGAYSDNISLYSGSGSTPLFIMTTGTDELCYASETTNIRSIVDRHNYTSTTECVANLWYGMYRISENANGVIAACEALEEEVGPNTRHYCEAGARFLRAWCHFQLVQFFGAVPIHDKVTEHFDYSTGRDPVKDVYKFIIEDLEWASQDGYLPRTLKPEERDGHANYWAVRTLLGKVYLTMASTKKTGIVKGYEDIEDSVDELYTKARTVLKDVIDNSDRDLLPNYRDIFKISNKNINAESIWEIQFSSVAPYGSSWSKSMGVSTTGGVKGGGWRKCSMGGNSVLHAVPSMRKYFRSQTQDVRRQYNICDSLITYDKTSDGHPTKIQHILSTTALSGVTDLSDNTNKSIVNYSSASKYRWGGYDPKTGLPEYPSPYYTEEANIPTNIIALRFADVLLMFAEADMMVNGGVATDEGLAAINRVVQRARGLDASGNPIPASATPELPDYTAETLTMEALMKERSCELCFEFWRRHDLVRTGMFEYFLAARNAATNLETYFDSESGYLLPIPQYEIDNSQNPKGMYQNPGYTGMTAGTSTLEENED